MKFCEKNVLCEKGDEITRFDGNDLRHHFLVLFSDFIIGMAQRKNLQICNCRMIPRICGLATLIFFACPPLANFKFIRFLPEKYRVLPAELKFINEATEKCKVKVIFITMILYGNKTRYITINVPLFTKLRDIIFFCGTITL